MLTRILRSIIHPFMGVREPLGDNHVAVCGGQLAILEQASVISSSEEQFPSEDNPVTSVLDLLELQLQSNDKQKG